MSENIDIEKENIPADDKEVKKHRHRHHSSHHGSHHSDKMSRMYEDSQRRVVRNTFRKVRREKVYKPIFRVVLCLAILAVIVLFFWSVINPPANTYEREPDAEKVSENVSVEEKIDALKAEIETYKAKITELEGEIAELEGDSESVAEAEE